MRRSEGDWRFSRGAVLGAAGALLLLVAGCEGEGGESNPPPAVCSTGSAWTKGDEGSELMHPGDDCIGCHTERGGEAPAFSVAGTVMAAYTDDTNCNGVQGVTVRLKDANGKTVDLATNAAGNFFLRKGEQTLAFPYTVTILKGTKQNQMATPQTEGSCNTCHTAQGANNAPGRVYIAQ